MRAEVTAGEAYPNDINRLALFHGNQIGKRVTTGNGRGVSAQRYRRERVVLIVVKVNGACAAARVGMSMSELAAVVAMLAARRQPPAHLYA